MTSMPLHSGSPGAAGPHGDAVTRAIQFMRHRLGDSQDLRGMAEAAFLSPFHFHRVFRAATGAPPGRFLTALRMATAKSLLLETGMSATEVSITVGYSSFGTFTSQFTRLVGIPPGRFRAFTGCHGHLRAGELARLLPAGPPGASIRCRISARPDRSRGLTLVGLFTSSIPQGLPRTCATAVGPEVVALPLGELAGSFTALAVSLAWEATVREILLEEAAAGQYVGGHPRQVLLGPAVRAEDLAIRLRPARVTDPPVLGAFPLLLAMRAGAPKPAAR